jgi:hypothetical protein
MGLWAPNDDDSVIVFPRAHLFVRVLMKFAGTS